jgi:hypothetical protein
MYNLTGYTIYNLAIYWEGRPRFFSHVRNTFLRLGTVVHVCNPSTWEVETRRSEFEASLCYTVRQNREHTNTTQNNNKKNPKPLFYIKI